DSAAGREARARVAGAVTRRPGGTGADDNDASYEAQETRLIVAQCHGSNVGPTGALRAGNGNASGGVPFVAGFANTAGETRLGFGVEQAPPITTRHGDPGNVLAFAENSRAEVRLEGGDGQTTGSL